MVTQLAVLTRDELRRLAPDSTAILPVAAIEQHGPHLPLITDTRIAEAVAWGAAKAAAPTPVALAPVMPYGSSHHHLAFTALSLRSDNLARAALDVAECLVHAGFRRILFLNAHGGNDDILKETARNLVLQHEVAAGAFSYWNVAMPALRAAGIDKVCPLPGHAGAFETALMLAIAPEMVRMDLAPREATDPPAFFTRDIAPGLTVQRHGEWARIGGYTDPSAQATDALGRHLLQIITTEVGKAITAFHHAAAE